MPPTVALFLTLVFSVTLLLRQRPEPPVSRALWLPVVWIFFISSRFLSQWLSVLGIIPSADATLAEGSPLDAAFFLLLIIAGSLVLVRRRVSLTIFITENRWLALFIAYSFLSILWSDFQFVAFKRWIKVVGHPVMALVILTERDQVQAIRVVLKRAACLMIPFSILWIKYYPHIGRGYDPWSGQAFNNGIHLTKNELGYTSMVFAIFFAWNYAGTAAEGEIRRAREEKFITITYLLMLSWLFSMADSATSLVCCLLGVLLIVAGRMRLISTRYLRAQLAASVLIVIGFETVFEVYERIVLALGRDPTLTDRTELWSDVLDIQINPVLGAGFESFWLGSRLDILWGKWWWRPAQAHNGYLETYLNLGLVGLSLLVMVVLSVLSGINRGLRNDPHLAYFRLSFLIVILAYNWTEAAFKGVHLVWTIFHLIAIDYPMRQHIQANTTPPVITGERVRAARAMATRKLVDRQGRVAARRLPRLDLGSRAHKSRS